MEKALDDVSKMSVRSVAKPSRRSATWRVTKVVSGGQTGVDRAALDVAIELGVDCGGWCPKGRRSEDGPIPIGYPLQETATTNYAERTALNIRESDATLILAHGTLRGGTALTKQIADRYRRPCLVVDPREPSAVLDVIDWLRKQAVQVLNIAGPRENLRGEVAPQAANFLRELLKPSAAHPVVRKATVSRTR